MNAMNHDFKNDLLRLQWGAVAAGLLLAAVSACAQTPAPAAPPASAPEAAPKAAPAPATPAPASSPPQPQGPAYTASNIALAFAYIDANRDGKISREEAAGFRGVAKYFDEADVNKDGFLSREEFENAMNRSQPK
jgi:EF hand